MANSISLKVGVHSPQRMWQRDLLKHVRRYPSLWIGGAMLGVFALLIAFAPIVTRYPPNQQNLSMRLKPPSAEYLFGTDELGRDIFSRVLHGGQISLPSALIVVLISLTLGGLLGAFAGFFGGLIDDVIMRVADVTLAFPAVVLALAISALLGPSLNNAILAACVVLWPEYARLIRSQVIVTRTFEYVTAARSLGRREVGILLRHVLPNTWTPILIKAALDIGGVILLVSALSFIGLGVSPPTAEWGSMVALGRNKFYQWWVATFPGLAILVSILACNLISEGLRNWLDPRT
ncbi:MAG: ABC transporter permease subunit [Aggregatilineales bacterium]